MAKTRPEPLEAINHDERRQDVRYRLEAPGLAAHADGVFDCIVADISVGGAMLEGDLPLAAGSEIALGFDSLIGVMAEVVHQGDGFLGVRFVHNAAQRRLIAAWIRAKIRDERSARNALPEASS